SLSGFYKFLQGVAAELRLPITVPNPAHAQFIARGSKDPPHETLDPAHDFPPGLGAPGLPPRPADDELQGDRPREPPDPLGSRRRPLRLRDVSSRTVSHTHGPAHP